MGKIYARLTNFVVMRAVPSVPKRKGEHVRNSSASQKMHYVVISFVMKVNIVAMKVAAYVLTMVTVASSYFFYQKRLHKINVERLFAEKASTAAILAAVRALHLKLHALSRFVTTKYKPHFLFIYFDIFIV